MTYRQEGIVIKNPLCTYSPGQRNKDWIKVKPDYVDSLGDDVDVLIIGIISIAIARNILCVNDCV